MGAKTGDFSKKSLISRYVAHTPQVAFGLFTLVATATLLWAWSVRDYRYIQAESGAGYILGIVGASLMVVLLLYPLRKRLRIMRNWLHLQSWFRLHMLLGVFGPLCILLHCNFRLGSTNSSVALACMLLVAGSGLIGRYLYGKFHYGLYGQQVSLQQLKTDLDQLYPRLEASAMDDRERQQLQALYEGCGQIVQSQRQKVSLRELLRQRRWLRQMTRQALPARSGNPDPGNQARQALNDHQRALAGLLDKLAGLRLFERLFGLWHVVHIPVFLLMVVTAIVHIVVVHWY